MGGYAWVTLATNDSYSLGALVLAHSLKKSKTAHKSVVLITPAVSQPMREQLQTVFDVIQVVDVLDSKDEAHLALMQRPELGITFTKIHCWKLVEFDKCVFLDADTLVVRNCDELFEREEFSAAPDVSWPDCFNSGVFVFRPSVQTFNELLQFAVEKGSFDGGDQGLLNQFFSGWATEDIKKHLPFVYNLTSVAAYSYIPAFKHYGSETRIVHFIGAGKPWLQQLDPATKTITPTSGSEHLAPLLQQWWDLFCDKVHPNLNKNLESNNDGMSHPPVAVCSNSLPIALTDDSQTPRPIEPCTPYREKDDFRQYNLPYQPFDVKGSSGELLNVEFLLTSAARPRSPEDVLDEERREGNGMEEKGGQEETNERSEKEKKNDSSTQESDGRKEAGSSDLISEMQQCRIEERISEWKGAEIEEQKQRQENKEQSKEPEQPSPTVHPFDYDSFFPDETCINKYLEQNVMTYQPYDSHSHHQLYEDQQHDNSENSISLSSHENSSEISNSDPQLQEDSVPSLPRFLTIPENDKRQSGNTEMQSDLPTKSDFPQMEPPTQNTEPLQEMAEEKRELTKSKSMPYLLFDVTEVPSSGCIWKSQPNVNVDPNRKYPMPKLRPILPRQNSLSRSVPSVAPKVTLYTEFLMSSEYKDPANLPKDKVGFVETLIHRKGQLRRSKSAADIGDKFGPLPYNSSPEIEQPVISRKTPSLHLDSELYDLSQCKRQMGNKPKTKDASRRKESSHSLPALKPLMPPKDKKSTLIKKRKSKELSPGDGGREKIFKKEPKMPKDRKRECRTTPRNVSEAGTGNNVDEILTRLREFSKNYQHFFGVELQPQNKTTDSMKADDAPASGAKQNPGEKKSEKQAPTVDSKFTNFRNYVKEKSRTSQKGLLSIQDLVSKPDDEVAENAKASSETFEKDSELKRGSERCENSVASAVAKEDSLFEGETSGKKVNINYQRYKVSEGYQGDDTPRRTLANEDNVKDNSEGTVKSAEHSTEAVKTNGLVQNSRSSSSSLTGTSEFKVTHPSHGEEDFLESQSTPVESGIEAGSSQEDAQRNGLAGEKSHSQKTESHDDQKLTSRETDVDKTTEKLEKSGPGDKKSRAAGMESKENLEFANKERDVEKPTERTYTKPTKLQELRVPEEPPAKSCLDGAIPNGNGCPQAHGSHFESAEPVRLTLTEKEPEEPECKSSPKGISSESNQLTAEMTENGEAQTNGVKTADLAGKEERTEEKLKNPAEVLLGPPRGSRAPLPTTKNLAIENVDDMLTKATLQQSQTSAPSPPASRKTRKAESLPKKPPSDRHTPPDETGRPVGGRISPAAGKLSPPSPSIPQNGNALPDSHEDMKICSGIAGAIAQLSLEAGNDPSSESAAAASTAHQEYLRRQNWETGNMDYMGRDSFDNIWSKICQTLEVKESEEAEPAAVSPKQSKEPSDPSVTVPAKEARTTEPPPIAETPAPPSTTLQKCPEYIETLPGEPAAGAVEDDEIIFSKPDSRQSCLTNIKEVEEDGKESSALSAKPADAGKVKLSDILQPGLPSSGLKEITESGKGENVIAETKTTAEKVGAPVDEKKEVPQAVKAEPEPSKVEEQRTTKKVGAPVDEKKEVPQAVKAEPEPSKVEEQRTTKKVGAPVDEKKEVPQAVKAEPEPSKLEDQTAAVSELPQQVPPGKGNSETSAKDEKSEADKKTEKCTTVAIPSPPIHFPGAPFSEKDKQAQSRRQPQEQAGEKFEPIPLPPPETPTEEPAAKPPDSGKDQGKQKKGVFTKILEMVGVAPKEKSEDEISKSVFYDVEGAARAGQEPAKDENANEPEKQAPAAEAETKEVSPVQVGGPKPEETQTQEKVVPATQTKEQLSLSKTEETKKETKLPEIEEKKPEDGNKSEGKVKPPRNVSPKGLGQSSKNSIQISQKSRSPSPKLTLPKDPPATAVTAPTPPPQPDLPLRKTSGLLKVDDAIPETPPIPGPPEEETEESVKGGVLAEVEDIIGKAKSSVETRLQERRSADKETEDSSDLINTMKLMVGTDQAAPPSPEVQMEELKVTSEEERMRHKGEAVSSKLSDQILKAIPPPRRKAISEGCASASATSKAAPAPEQKAASAPQQKAATAGESKGKAGKGSSIPVPPPRSRGKPAQPTPSKGKGKK